MTFNVVMKDKHNKIWNQINDCDDCNCKESESYIIIYPKYNKDKKIIVCEKCFKESFL